MTQTPAGWYPDHQQPVLRYWDGDRWTEHTSPYPSGPPGDTGARLRDAHQGHDPRATTPDGEPLAGWWQRVGAVILDGLIVFAVATPLALPWWRDVFEVYGDYFDEISATGSSTVSSFELQSQIAGPLAIIGVIGVVLNFVYVVGFLTWKQATPGKLALGLRVRQREAPHGLPLSVVLKRWLVQGGPQALSIVPLVGTLVGLFSLVDALWPLWDSRRQAIHDKWADTNVVRRRR